jgi:hypothetical protein
MIYVVKINWLTIIKICVAFYCVAKAFNSIPALEPSVARMLPKVLPPATKKSFCRPLKLPAPAYLCPANIFLP